MNFFFFADNDFVFSKLEIPKFNNAGRRNDDLKLFGAFIQNNAWQYYRVESQENDNFHFLTSTSDNKDHVFFYHANSLPNEGFFDALPKPSEFTHTSPAFRANLSIHNQHGGFSSYQSEYPYAMTRIKSSMVTSAGNLTMSGTSNCGVFLRNISAQPLHTKNTLYIWDEDSEEILDKTFVYSNKTNFVCLKKFLENTQNIGLFCDTMVGIPIFVIEYENQSLSFEHTHPPHENIHGENRYRLVKSYKSKVSEKILKKSLA